MDETRFWQMIDEARTAAQGDQDKIVDHLVDALAALPVEEIIDFQVMLDAFMHKADNWDMYGAATIICSPGDDGWSDFRAWLIAQGKDVFYKALDNPETLVSIADTIPYNPDYSYYNARLEAMLSTAVNAYRQKTGNETADVEFHALARDKRQKVAYPTQRTDTPRPWKHRTLYMKLPNLTARFSPHHLPDKPDAES